MTQKATKDRLAHLRAWRERQEITLELTPEHKLVYEGGHHSVYCDGKTHFWGFGGFVWQLSREDFLPEREGPCDCTRWANFNKQLEGG